MKLGNRLPDSALVERAWDWAAHHAPHVSGHGYLAHYHACKLEWVRENRSPRRVQRAIARDLREHWAPVMNAFQAWDLAN